jgi:uncharacterized protein (DUF433 family)
MTDLWKAIRRTQRTRLSAGDGLAPGVRSDSVEHSLVQFDRITVDPAKLGGKPCIRGHRFSVEHLLELLAAGWSAEEIRADFSFIEPEDIQQALAYAATLRRGAEPVAASDQSPKLA